MNLIPLSRRFGWRIAGLLTLVGALLSACGGGTSVVNAFKPSRLIVFGDEHSALSPNPSGTPTGGGYHYGINARTNGVYDCRLDVNWTQVLAASYGFSFAECPITDASATTVYQALMRAALGAKTADLVTQVDAQVQAASGIGSGDLVSVMMGANDIIEVYEARFGAGKSWSAAEETAAANELAARGAVVAGQVMRLMDRGAKVIVATVPDLGLSPYAYTEKAAHTDHDRSALITALTFAFNARLRVAIDPKKYDGRDYGLVLGDETVQVMALAPGSYGLTNVDTVPDVTTAACAVALPVGDGNWCFRAYTPATGDTAVADPGTLVTSATDSNHLWATDRWLGPVVQSRIGSLAQSRAQSNPF
jgi:hypothetical protein